MASRNRPIRRLQTNAHRKAQRTQNLGELEVVIGERGDMRDRAMARTLGVLG